MEIKDWGSVDILPKKEILAHRELHTAVQGRRLPREAYTLGDLWRYYGLSFLGRRSVLSMRDGVAKEEIEAERKSILEDLRPPSEEEVRSLLEYCEAYGTEVVLYAIDEFAGVSEDPAERNIAVTFIRGVPEARTLGAYLSDALGFVNRLRYEVRGILG